MCMHPLSDRTLYCEQAASLRSYIILMLLSIAKEIHVRMPKFMPHTFPFQDIINNAVRHFQSTNYSLVLIIQCISIGNAVKFTKQ